MSDHQGHHPGGLSAESEAAWVEVTRKAEESDHRQFQDHISIVQHSISRSRPGCQTARVELPKMESSISQPPNSTQLGSHSHTSVAIEVVPIRVGKTDLDSDVCAVPHASVDTAKRTLPQQSTQVDVREGKRRAKRRSLPAIKHNALLDKVEYVLHSSLDRAVFCGVTPHPRNLSGLYPSQKAGASCRLFSASTAATSGV